MYYCVDESPEVLEQGIREGFGGVTTLDDVKKLAEMKLYGAILGKALYTGNIDLAAAVTLTKEGNE